MIILRAALDTRPFSTICCQKYIDLTYAKVMEIASSMEASDRNMRSFKGSDSVLRTLHSHTGKGKETQPCFPRKRSGHSTSMCKFREATAHITHIGSKAIVPACHPKNKVAPKPSGKGVL